MTNHYIYFPAGWTRRPKLNIPESINKRIQDEKNRVYETRDTIVIDVDYIPSLA